MCNCDRLIEAIDRYIEKADDDLTEALAEEGYAYPEKTVKNMGDVEQAVVEGIQMPKPNELLSAKQRDGTELRAKQIYEDTWNWLNSIGCAGYVPPQTIERYAMCVARWLQCEEMTNELGFLSKHPTTGKPVTSPFIDIGINYMNQASRQWDNIMQIVKENCSVDFYTRCTPSFRLGPPLTLKQFYQRKTRF